jgi:hypothetical protein
MWRQHDRILASNCEVAREIQSQIPAIDQRLDSDLQNSNDTTERASIQARKNILHKNAEIAQRACDLDAWARNDEGRASRPEHPCDTGPAVQPKYAEALGLAKDESPISPMRGVIQLQRILLNAYVEVSRL